MNADNPRVSVVLPTHNRPELLSEAIASVLEQTHADWELIIVDDASMPPVPCDMGDSRIRVVRHDAALGGAAAKNTGAHHALGDVLAFLDDDDCYAPGYLARALEALDTHAEVDVVFMGVSWFGSRAESAERNYRRAMSRFMSQAGGTTAGSLTLFSDRIVPALLNSVPMAFQRPVVRRDANSRIGGYRSDCLLWDCDWAIEAAIHARVALEPHGLYRQRVDGQGYSSRGDRTADQLRSGVDIKDRLLQRSLADPNGQYARFREPIRRSSAQAWFDLAWYHYGQGQRPSAVRALAQAVRRRFESRQLKLAVRVLLAMKPSRL
jgi:hypothetical protein